MIHDVSFRLDENSRELSLPYRDAFPCGIEFYDSSGAIGKIITWHWHPYFEINYVTEGEVIYRIDQEEYLLKKGEAIFINASRLHMISLPPHCARATHYAVKFDKSLFCGTGNNYLEEKYISPVLNNRGFSSYAIRPDSEAGVHMISRLHRLFHDFLEEPFGYEYHVIGELGQFWAEMLSYARAEGCLAEKLHTSDNDKILPMIQYITDHYQEKISLPDIASAASISTRECDRCFARYIRMSPMEYLNFYRVRKASEMLVHTQNSILDISQECGFHSSSYFSKLFRREFGCNPREFRDRHTQD